MDNVNNEQEKINEVENIKVVNNTKQETLVQKQIRLEQETETYKKDIETAHKLVEDCKKKIWAAFNMDYKEKCVSDFDTNNHKTMETLLMYLFRNLKKDIKNEDIYIDLIKKINEMYIYRDKYVFNLYGLEIKRVLYDENLNGYVIEFEMEDDPFSYKSSYLPDTISFTNLYNLVNEYKEKDKQMSQSLTEEKEKKEKADRYEMFLKLKEEFEPVKEKETETENTDSSTEKTE